MNVIKLGILWLSANQCLAQISKRSPKFNEYAFRVEILVTILSRCYDKQVSTVGFAGNFDDFPVETLSSQLTLSMALIGTGTYDGRMGWESRHKLELFVVTASSLRQLKMTLRQMKSSLWWNHMATVLILDWQFTSTEQGCSNASEFLWAAWEMNLLKATYLCVHQTKEGLIYSYNPYTSKAPEPWKLETTYKGKNDHPWTVFRREYDNDTRVCKNLEFDKTNDLAGYKIYASVKEVPPVLIIDVNKTGLNSISTRSGHLSQVIFRALNATVHLKVHYNNQSPGLLDTNGYDIAMDTVNNISDILLTARALAHVPNFTISVAFIESGLCIVTQYSGQQSQLQKLVTVLDERSRIGLCLVALTMVIFFKFFRRESIWLAILNSLRIIANSSLTKVPKNQGARIYLAGVFFLVVTIVGIYQGMLASLLTKSKSLPNVETMQHLVDRGYTIHTHKTHEFILGDPVFRTRAVTHADIDCTEIVSLDSSAACVAPEMVVFNVAAKRRLHISTDPVYKRPVGYVIREDWPLEARLNKILEALTEAHLVQYYFEMEKEATLNIATYYENLEKNRKFKVMTLSELTFAFAILGIGLLSATVCFILEVAISSMRLTTRNVVARIRNPVNVE